MATEDIALSVDLRVMCINERRIRPTLLLHPEVLLSKLAAASVMITNDQHDLEVGMLPQPCAESCLGSFISSTQGVPEIAKQDDAVGASVANRCGEAAQGRLRRSLGYRTALRPKRGSLSQMQIGKKQGLAVGQKSVLSGRGMSVSPAICIDGILPV